MSDIILKADVKTMLGISGTTQDDLIDFYIETAQEILYKILDITDLYSHEITKEIARVYHKEYFYLDEFPVTAISSIHKVETNIELTGYYFSIDNKNKRKVWIVNSDGEPYWIGYNMIKVTYTAGYMEGTGDDDPDINIPKTIKLAVALMIGGLLAEKQKKGGLVEYSVGAKRIKFSDQESADAARRILNRYIMNYKNPSPIA